MIFKYIYVIVNKYIHYHNNNIYTNKYIIQQYPQICIDVLILYIYMNIHKTSSFNFCDMNIVYIQITIILQQSPFFCSLSHLPIRHAANS